MAMTRYVAGFLFSKDLSKVVLILKRRGPKINIGKWNAVGGKIEPGESVREAQTREFEEETGLYITDWRPFALVDFFSSGKISSRVTFLVSYSDNLSGLKTVEDEQVGDFYVDEIDVLPLAENLEWLLPLAKKSLFNPSLYIKALQNE